MSSLFRPEVLESRQNQWLGGISLIRPLPLQWLTAFAVLAAAAVLAYLALGEYTRKARLSGHLVPDGGVVRLVAPQVATVLESHVAEGRTVQAGELLYVLSVDAANQRGSVRDSLDARRRSLRDAAIQQQALDRERLTALTRQLEGMRDELAQLDHEAQLQAQRLGLAEKALQRLEALRADNFVSPTQVQSKAEEVLGLRAQAQSLLRQRATHVREMEQLQARAREVPLQGESRRGEIDRDIAELAQEAAENEAQRRIELRAPHDGVLTGVVAQVGQSVGPSVALASLLPSGARLEAHLFAPSSAIGFVQPEQAVQLRYQAYPYQKFGLQTGHVTQVSRAPMQASELDGPAGEPLYRITVALDRQDVSAYGRPQALVPGMQLEADVMLERRRLIEWLFEPLLGLAGRV
ncbi:MAG: HlyD family efflux transporter periplasmic adaptor subunit [Piscinibacter sp.]|nr:HlyD family efflux transporter periplasmic adaptor subunit [Piscinibacter sp.]